MSHVLKHLSDYAGVQTVFVYISEAHAEDEWPIATPKPFVVETNATTIAERTLAARKARTALPGLADFPTYLDTFDTNNFMSMYGAWPTQLFLFKQGRLLHKARPEAAEFDVVEFYSTVKKLLDSYR
eukprot:m.258808 g.258808  ORF g.258808 m.258808 type:complete len:127 (+) comp37107_c0_seq1:77-457(+)